MLFEMIVTVVFLVIAGNNVPLGGVEGPFLVPDLNNPGKALTWAVKADCEKFGKDHMVAWRLNEEKQHGKEAQFEVKFTCRPHGTGA